MAARTDRDAERALTLAAELNAVVDVRISVIRSVDGRAEFESDGAEARVVPRALLDRAAEEIRWLVESRARWMAACYAQQITVYEEAPDGHRERV